MRLCRVTSLRGVTDLEVRDLTLDDRDATLGLRNRSFGPLPDGGRGWFDTLFTKNVEGRRALGVFHDAQLVAAARLHEYRQLWHGGRVPMSGVAGVYVAPEWRGRGVAGRLLTAVLHRSHALGDAVAVLFPSVLPPYRRLGFELAGAVTKTTFTAETLRALGPPTVSVRRATAADAANITLLLRRYDEQGAASGPLDLDEDEVREQLADDDNLCYVADDGVVLYAWDGDDLRVERVAAAGPETLRSLWALAGSGASIVRNVYTYQPLHDAVHWIVDVKAQAAVEQESWMLRLIDAELAISSRGFPAGLDIEVAVSLEDPWLPSCAGDFWLTVTNGTGRLVRGVAAPDAVRLGPNGVAALYAGVPPVTIGRAGLLAGGSAVDLARLDAAFGCRPYLIDAF